MNRAPDPTPEQLAELAALLGGQLHRRPHDDENQPATVRLESPRCLLYVRSLWGGGGKWTAFIQDLDGRSIHNAPRANVNPARGMPAIAADLRRRVLDPARAAIVAHETGKSSRAAAAQDIAAKIASLESAAGASNAAGGSSCGPVLQLPGFEIKDQYDLSGCTYTETFRASIRVHSFDCLRMIARLVAEDHRLHEQLRANRAQQDPDPDTTP